MPNPRPSESPKLTKQLPLALRWPPHQRFEHFFAGTNAAALATLQQVVTGAQASWPFLAGARGSGKTHLLIAACQLATENDCSVQYLPLQRVKAPLETAIRSSGGSQFLAVDDVQQVAGNAAAEHALFDLYNRARAEGTTMLFAAREAPAQLALGLPDLRSRLGACTLLPLQPLTEQERRKVLREHAAARGIRLDDAVLDWLFTRHARDLVALHDLLERMDRASLAARRRITIPFLREFLREDSL